MKYLFPKQINYLHERIIEESGGTLGLRDEGLLESAVYRPQATFGGQDLYPDLFTKISALGHSLICNHAFVDGNKRVGFEAMRLMLRINHYDLHASSNKKFKFVMEIATGKMAEQAIAVWLKRYSRPYR